VTSTGVASTRTAPADRYGAGVDGLRRLSGRRARRAAPLGPQLPLRPAVLGGAAPPIDGVDPAGRPVRVDFPAVAPTLVAFLTSGCGGCQVFWRTLGDPGPARPLLPGDPALVVVTPSPALESSRAVRGRAAPDVVVVMDGDAWLAWGAQGAPWFAVVTGGVVSAEGRAGDWSDLATLVRRTL
jgi:hypothetical protein